VVDRFVRSFDGRRPPGALPETSAARRGTAAFVGRAIAENPDRHLVTGDDVLRVAG
jgi:hypothetical protein